MLARKEHTGSTERVSIKRLRELTYWIEIHGWFTAIFDRVVVRDMEQWGDKAVFVVVLDPGTGALWWSHTFELVSDEELSTSKGKRKDQNIHRPSGAQTVNTIIERIFA